MLRKTGNCWKFVSEAALEEFVWANLGGLFELTPLKQQYYCNSEVCDILALSRDKQLTVIELKNCEDRYIVQQLTRYHFNLTEERSFSQEIDYGQPIRLVGVAPSFHRHNLIDRQHNILRIEFWQYEIDVLEGSFYLKLEEIDQKITSKIEIPYKELKEFAGTEGLPELPQSFDDYLGIYSQSERERILRLRAKLLTFDDRMQETVTAKSIKYGKGEGKPCAEFYLERKKRSLILILWLVDPSSLNRLAISRMRLWTKQWETASYFAYAKEGLGKAKLEEEWQSIPKEKWPRQHLYHSVTRKSDIAIKFTTYKSFANRTALIEQAGIKLPDSDSLEELIEHAALIWQSRL